MSMLLQWLPPVPDFRAALAAAVAATPGDSRLEHVVRLSRHRLDYLQNIQLSRTLDKLAGGSRDGLRAVRLGVIGSTTLDHLLPALRTAALRRRLWLECHVGSYGLFRQDAQPGSALHQFKPEVVLISLSATSVLPDLPISAGAAEVSAAVRAAIAGLAGVWTSLRASPGVRIIQQNFLDTTLPLLGSADFVTPAAPAELTRRLNAELAAAALLHDVQVLDIATQAQRDGLAAWFDYARMLQAKQEIAPTATPAYGELVARLIAAQYGLSKKCLVLDLDNTLWGGVVGDDGAEGLVLGQGSALGEAFADLQRYVQQLARRGVALAVCSKNDAGIAEAAFTGHPEMILKRSDIAVFTANWRDKASNLRDIATTLNIGVDSLVLLDDNPAERAQVRSALPEVGVPEISDDPADYARTLAAAGYFESITSTAEDLARSEYYAANAQRSQLQASSGNIDDFLRELDMEVTCQAFNAADMTRITQLINKTNQFNTTTRRYSAEEIAALASRPGAIALSFRLKDRLGDNGLVSAMILVPDEHRARALRIDTWVMSCRVFGRRLEHEALAVAVAAAASAGVESIVAAFVPTAKNGVIANLFQELGFVASDQAHDDSASEWQLRIADHRPVITHMRRAET